MSTENIKRKIIAVIAVIATFVIQMGWLAPEQVADAQAHLVSIVENGVSIVLAAYAAWLTLTGPKKAPVEEEE